MIYFRRRIGEAGIEMILKESIRVNNDNGDSVDSMPIITCSGKRQCKVAKEVSCKN